MNDDPDGPRFNAELRLALQRLTRDKGVERKDLLEALEGRLNALRGYWGLSFKKQDSVDHDILKRAARSTIVANLTVHISRLVPPQGTPKKQFDRAVSVGFNIKHNAEYAALKGLDLMRRLEWLETRAPDHERVAARTSRSYISSAIDQIVEQIAAAGFKSVQIDAQTSDVSLEPGGARYHSIAYISELVAPHPKYVPQAAYHERFRRFLNESIASVFVLAGPRGVGKSRLALELIRGEAHPDDGFIRIEGSSRATAIASLNSYVSSLGIEARSDQLEDLAVSLAGAVSQPHRQWWIVLDGVEDAELVQCILPTPVPARVIVTSNVTVPGERYQIIEVAPMMEADAVQLMTSILPDAEPSDIRELTAELDFRPLAIVQVGAYLLTRAPLSIHDFLADFSRNPSRSLDAPRATVDVTLTAIYRRTLEDLFERGEVAAAQILELLAFTGPGTIDGEIVLQSLRLSCDDRDFDRTEFHGAMLVLESRFLAQWQDEGIVVHSFTRSLLRDLLDSKKVERCAALWRVLQHRFEQAVDGDVISSEIKSLMAHGMLVAKGLDSATASQIDDLDPDRGLAILLRFVRQEGDSFGVRALIQIIIDIHGAYSGDQQVANFLMGHLSESWMELIRLKYCQYELSSEAYLSHIRLFFRLPLSPPDDKEWLSADIDGTLEYVEALLADSQTHEALNLLVAQESRFGPDAVASTSTLHIARYMRLRAHSAMALGSFGAETDLVNTGLRLLSDAGLDNIAVAREAIHLWDLCLEVTLKSRPRGDERERELARILRESEALGEVMEATHDYLNLAQATALATKFAANIVIAEYVAEVRETGRLHMSSTTSQKAELASELVDQQVETFESSGDERQASDFRFYQLLLSACSLHRLPLVLAGELLDGVIKDERITVHCLTQVLKVNILWRGRIGDPPNTKAIERLMAFALDENQDLYWRCEALGIVMVMLILADCPPSNEERSAILSRLEAGYAALGRPDRWSALNAALAALSKSPAEFCRQYSYLLYW